ncbi:methyltransferase, FkbM family [Blastococcus aurantiacus]|uniref:Methyltransferase, FkbM family n=1 Tax=Blastococcus aurantiacus TaxID=1550231 RepID=A0A1G7PLJ2_9ACTN|nr:FkbM family methyltransferase [Blastococcus aurantiacus]SDF87272.1 methyltransferase, FkbM family [Blastococcus aurantiacus]
MFADPPVVRLAWRSLFLGERLVRPVAARLTAALALRATARSSHSYAKTVRRISPRLRADNPGLVKIPDRWSRNPTVRVRRNGLALELDLRDNLQAVLFYTGVYEPRFTAHLLNHLRPGDVVADVGAHIGVHSLAVARRLHRLGGGGSVLAFEPAADSAATLRGAAVRNGLDVEVLEAACSDVPGRLPLFADERYPVADAGVRSLHGRGQQIGEVSAVRFDDWAADRPGGPLPRLDVVKLDVEGHEAAALSGMRNTLARLRPRALYVEIKENAMGRAVTSDERLRDLLTDLGYRTTGRTFDHNELFAPVG